jgi:DivIVA domain-containing protein
MADEVTSGEIRTRQFDVVRKGYDRNQVELFLAQVARQFDTLESSIAEAADNEIALGIDDSEALARELATIGGEIDVILESARSAAEGMRVRATADAETRTSDAKTYVEESTSEADTQAHAARGSAWDEGSSMLEAATEEATSMVEEAETDALRIRAEAEREAIRYTADAKRASEEAIGAAESEAEGILSTSRAESERVLRAASQSAELAQERARALEDRRSELLVELESTRSSIGELETEFESKRQALEEPEPVSAPEYEDRTHQDASGGTVKIISGSKVVPLTPVDADSFVAEVAEMHRSAAEEEPEEEIPETRYQIPEEEEPAEEIPETRYQIPEEEEPVLDASLPQLAGGDVEERDRGGIEESVASSQPEEEIPETRDQIPEEEQPSAEEVEPSPVEDSIGSLFAQLREDTAASESESPTASDAESEERRAESASSAEGASDADSGERRAEGDFDAENAPPGASLIPVQNSALRTIKRQLVDLQNDALEHLRTDEAWVPTEEFTDRFSEPFSELAIAITDDGDDRGAASVFATDLYDAVSNAVVGAREAGSGDRAIAAATSKVFRTWRSDEAERRVVGIASDLSEHT